MGPAGILVASVGLSPALTLTAGDREAAAALGSPKVGAPTIGRGSRSALPDAAAFLDVLAETFA